MSTWSHRQKTPPRPQLISLLHWKEQNHINIFSPPQNGAQFTQLQKTSGDHLLCWEVQTVPISLSDSLTTRQCRKWACISQPRHIYRNIQLVLWFITLNMAVISCLRGFPDSQHIALLSFCSISLESKAFC